MAKYLLLSYVFVCLYFQFYFEFVKSVAAAARVWCGLFEHLCFVAVCLLLMTLNFTCYPFE